jgi:hypothetical protein
MDKIKWELITLTLVFLLIFFSSTALAKEDAGRVLAVKNKALIERGNNKLTAKARQDILMQDTTSTMKASKLKLRFNDDSILTLGESSKVVIKEYVYNKGKGGSSVFNLLDGKMRSVVGKTKFQIHTPTAVAAARGTIILTEVGMIAGRLFTVFICLEGEIIVTSSDSDISGSRLLKPGMMITVFEKDPLPEPVQLSSKTTQPLFEPSHTSTEAAKPSSEPAQQLYAKLESIKAATEMDYTEPFLSMPEVVRDAPIKTIVDKTRREPPIEQQPGARICDIKINK